MSKELPSHQLQAVKNMLTIHIHQLETKLAWNDQPKFYNDVIKIGDFQTNYHFKYQGSEPVLVPTE